MMLTQQEVSQLIEGLNDCPPTEIYAFCDTPDRPKYFDSIRYNFTLIADELGSYFSGNVTVPQVALKPGK